MNIIQIGCNDCDDHVFAYVSEHQNEIGALMVVDALQKCVDVARAKYAFLGQRMIPVHCAVGTKNGLTEFYFPRGQDMSAHASMSAEHLYKHQHAELESVVVPCLAINVLLAAFARPVDRLYVDLEGLDADVLLSLEFAYFKPRFVEFEFLHSDGAFQQGEKFQQLLALLQANRYACKQSDECAYNIQAQLTA